MYKTIPFGYIDIRKILFFSLSLSLTATPSFLSSSQQNDNEWSMLLKKQEEYYQKQLTNLQSVLITTHNALQNVTTTLNQLSQFNSRSS